MKINRAVTTFISAILFLLLMLFSTGSYAATITVCSSGCDFTTIQGAIDDSGTTSGDTVQVGDGTYAENIDFSGKNITIVSDNGAGSTTITGDGSNDAVVSFENSETSSAVLDGFTINNSGTSSATRGILISSATPTIQNTTITGNNADNAVADSSTNCYGGAGVCIYNAAPTFDTVTIKANTALNRKGCGIYIQGAAGGATITDSTIGGDVTGDGNKCTNNEGGGIYFTGSTSGTLSITGSTIKYNESSHGGGGMYLNSITNTTSITNSTVSYNKGTNGHGGAIYSNNSPISINNTNLDNNQTTTNKYGGAIYATGSSATVTITNNSTLNNNTPNHSGGAIYMTSSGILTLTDATVTGNNANGANGGGIYLNSITGTSIITDTTIDSNTTGANQIGGGIYANDAAFTMTGGSVSNNTTSGTNGRGGGIYITSSVAKTYSITGTSIKSNETGQNDGAGIRMDGATTTLNLDRCYVQGNYHNVSGGEGGGLFIGAGTATVTNSVFTGNSTGNNYWDEGGGIYNNGTLTVKHSTFANNWANRQGGGIHNPSSKTATITGSLFWNNNAGDSGEEDIRDDGNMTVDYSAVENGAGYTGSNNVSSITGTVFTTVGTVASYNNPQTDGDFHIKTDATEIIDAADPASSITEDIDEDSRSGSTNDIGADELAAGGNNAPFGGYTADNVIPTAQVTQSTNGDAIMTVSFRAKDADTDSVTLNTFQYSVNGGVDWNAPTNADSSGSLSTDWNDGGSSYSSATDWTGTVHSFTFDTDHADVTGISGTDQSDIQVRFTVNDGIDDSAAPATSQNFQVDDLAPTSTITSGSYNKNTNTLVITGTNFTTIASASTDIKTYVDWTKFVWDINGDDATTANVTFVVGDITSLTVTDATTLTLIFTGAKATALEGTSGYGPAGGDDTLDVTAGFSKDAVGNPAVTDARSDGTLTTNTAPVGGYTADNVIPSAQVTQSSNGDGIITINWKARDDQSDGVTLNTFEYSVNGGGAWNAPTNADTSASLSTNWDDNGSSWSSATSLGAATAHSFTFDTNHADVSGMDGIDQSDVQVRFLVNDGTTDSAAEATSQSFQVDNVAPTATITSASYTPSTDTLVVTGTNFTTIAAASTDVKSYVDWTKFVWDINGDNATTANITFAEGDITSATVTNATTLTIIFTSGKGTAIETTSGYGVTGGNDTLDVTAGFSKDAAGNIATTDTVADGTLTTPIPSYNVTKTADTNDGTCDADCSLREAIKAANDAGGLNQVNVPSGTYTITLSGSDDTNALGDFDITDDVKIVGAGSGLTIIRAGSSLGTAIDRIFHDTTSASVTIEDVKIQYGKITATGGCILTAGNLTIKDSIIDSCTATSNHGGAVYSSSSISLDNVTITNGTAGNSGGAIYSSGVTGINGATIQNNYASNYGGGIYNLTNDINMNGTLLFDNNDTQKSTNDNGGAIYTTGNIVLNDTTGASTFSNNDALGGGAIWVNDSSKTITMTNPTFDTNTCTNNGGSIYGYGITVTGGATFQNNSSGGAGGAIYNMNTDISMNGTILFDNNDTGLSTNDNGGAIWTSGNLYLNATTGASTFSNNDALGGGAIWMNDSSKSITMVNPTLDTNTAINNGGAISVYGITITGGITAEDNYAGGAGGAIYSNSATVDVSIDGTILFNNNDTAGSTNDHGGAIYSQGNIILNPTTGSSTFTNNLAQQGGAIYLNGTTKSLTISNGPTFTNNTAYTRGGAIYASNITITGGATINTNDSADHGGGIYNSNGELNIDGIIMFDGNYTPNAGTSDYGGAIYSMGNIVLNATSGTATFQNNAGYVGGAIYAPGYSITTSAAISFLSNTANNQGGAIKADGVTMNDGVTVTNNSSVADGGAFYIKGGTLTDVNFTNNRSTANDGGAIYNLTNALTISGTNTFDSNYSGYSSGDFGGTIYSNADLTISDATFTADNDVNPDSQQGGAIYMLSGTLNLDTVSFTNFYADSVGGAIVSRGGTFTDVTFTGNHAYSDDGGAIANYTGTLTINGTSNVFTSNYTANSTGDYGGTIYSSGPLTISNADFNGDNDATADAGYGGAIFIDAVQPLTLSNVTFDNFYTTYQAGAIYSRGGTFTDVTFTGNHSDNDDGGAIMNVSALLTINGTSNTFTNNYTGNSTGDYGGSIYSTAPLTISNTTFTGNNDATADAGYGGAIFMDPSQTLTLSSVSFVNFYATYQGGAVYSRGGTFTDVTFTGNHAANDDGGAIFNSAGILTINGTSNTFTNNYTANGAGDYGGSIYSSAALTINDAAFTGNGDATADANYGGAIFMDTTAALTITDSSFKDFYTNSHAGAIYMKAGSITGSTFESNSTTGDGGAVYGVNAGIKYINTTFSANDAGSDGGAIYSNASCTIKNSTFYNNTATATAEAIRGTSCTVANTIVAKSTSSSSLCTSVTSNDYNIQYNGTCFTAQGNDLSSDPKLNALSDNGGPTKTHELQSTSPAIDAADNTLCADADVNNLDQRGTSRPIDGNATPGAICDIGAFEAPVFVSPYFSGSIYSDEGTTKITDSTTVHLVINGVSEDTDTTTTGDYSITPSSFSAGDKILVYIDNDGTNDGNTITVSDGNTLTGLDIYKDRVIVRHDNGGTLSNADMGSAHITDAGDILYSVDGSDNLTVTGTELFVWSGDTFTPGASVTAVDVDINGTMNAAANALNVSGNWDATGGVFTSTGTVTFNASSGTKTITPGGTDADHDFQNLIFNDAAGTATFELQGAIDIDNDLTVTDGIVDTKSGSNYAITVGNDFSQAAAGQVEANSSTITVAGDFSADGTTDSTDYNNASLVLTGTGGLTYDSLTSSWTNGFSNLTVGQSGNTTTLNDQITVLGALSVGSGEFTGNYVVFLSGTGDVLVFDADSTVSIITLTFYLVGAQNIPTLSNGYDCNIRVSHNNNTVTQTGNVTINGNHDLIIDGHGTASRTSTYDTAEYDLIVGGSITIGSGDDTGLKTLDGTNSAISAGGDFTVEAVGSGSTQAVFTSTGSTVTLNGSADQTITSSGSAFNNLTLNNTGSSGSDDIIIADAIDIDSTLTITNGDLDIGTNDPAVNTSGAVTIASDGSIDVTGRTANWTFDGTTALTDSSSGGPQDLEDVVLNGTSLTLAGNAKVQTMTNTSGTLNLGSSGYILEIDGTGTPLSNSGTFTAGTSTVKYTGSGSATDITTLAYSSLHLAPTSSTTYSLTGHLTGGNAMTADLTVDDNATLDTTAGNNYGLTVGGNYTQSSTSSNVVANSSTITVAGNFVADGTVDSTDYNSATIVLNGSGSIINYNNLSSWWANGFYNLTVGQSGVTDTLNNWISVLNDLTIGTGELTGPSTLALIGTDDVLVFDAASNLSINTLMFLKFSGNQNIPMLTNGYDSDISLAGDNLTVTQTGAVTLNSGKDLLIKGDGQTGRAATYSTATYDLTVGGNIVVGQGGDTALKSFNGTNSAISVAGDFTVTAVGGGDTQATFTSTGSTVTLNGTVDQTVTSSSQTFNALTLNNTGTGGSDDIIIADTLDINGTLTITNGDLDIGSNDPAVNTAGTVTISNDGSIDVTGRTADWTFDGTTTLTDSSSSGPQDLEDVVVDGTSLTLGSNAKVQTMTITSGTLDLASSGYVLEIDGTGTPLSNSGTFTAGTSTVKYTGSGTATNITSLAYSSLQLTPTSATTYSLTGHLTGGNELAGSLTIDTDATLTTTGSNYNITFAGDWDNNGSFTAGTSTVTLSGTNQDVNGSTSFYNLTKSVTSADTLTFEAGETTAIAAGGTVTLKGATGELLTLASSTGSSAWNFTVNDTATKDIDYVSVSWSDASGSHSSQKPIYPTNSTDGNNNTDWFGGTPTITVSKLSVVISDPLNGGTNPKRIPGAVIEYSVTPSNSGDGSPDADSVYVTDPIDTASVEFHVTTGVTFTDGSTSSDLSLGTVTYSDDASPGPYTYDYTPSPDGGGYDSNITSFKATTTGTFANGGTPDPSFTLKFRVRIK